MSALRKVREAPAIPALSAVQARADREAAEGVLRDARAAVQAAVDKFPAPMNRRAWIEDNRPLASRGPRPLDYTRSSEADTRLDQYDAFCRAAEAEERAERALERAKGAEVAAFAAEFGDGRAALAATIANAAGLVAEVDAARAVAERSRGALVKARQAHAAAEAALAEAREAAVGAIAEEGVQPTGLKDLRRAAAEAFDEVDLALEAVRRAEASLSGLEDAGRRAQAGVDGAARAVLAADAGAHFRALDAMIHDFKCRAFCRVYYLDAATSDHALNRKASDLLSTLARLGSPIERGTNPFPIGDDLFAETLAALMLDAAAPLPEMP